MRKDTQNKPPFKGQHSYASSAQDGPYPDFGTTPRAGQAAKPYVSGANAHNVHQRPTRGPAPGEKSGHARGDGPYKGFTGK